MLSSEWTPKTFIIEDSFANNLMMALPRNKVGYTSTSYFIRNFKGFFGITLHQSNFH